MQTKTIKISKNQYLKDILEFIPSNSIIDKTVPGLGATTLEITCNRNSIIIEPNVPVIKGKSAKHGNILGVYEGITVEKIKKYLNSETEFKKILTTPESYFKVQEAFKKSKFNLYKDFFLLFDECDKIITDIDYRENINFPMTDFWNYEKKSFISATPIKSSNPEFEKQQFQHIIIEPTYDYKVEIEVANCKSTVSTLRLYLQDAIKNARTTTERYFLFINSTDTIKSIIEAFDIKEYSNIYGSDDCVEKLNEYEYTNVFSELSEFNTFNFLTARFFSAVDIELDFKPHVFIITDANFASHTMVIPQIESVQIIGRFRNNMFKTFTHIILTNPNMEKISIEEVKNKIKGEGRAYKQIHTLWKNTLDPSEKAAFKKALETMDLAKFISNNQINWFTIDNILLDQWLKNTYNNFGDLMSQYNSTNFFKVKEADFSAYHFEELEFLTRNLKNKKERRKEIVTQLELLDINDLSSNLKALDKLKEEDPLIVKVFMNKKLGLDFIKEVDYNTKKMQLALAYEENLTKKDSLAVIDAVYKIFKVGQSYKASYIKKTLNEIFAKFGLEENAKGTSIKDFFEVSDERVHIPAKNSAKRSKGYKLIRTILTLPKE